MRVDVLASLRPAFPASLLGQVWRIRQQRQTPHPDTPTTPVTWLAEALAQRPTSESLLAAVLASVESFPHDLKLVRQAAIARSTLISAERVAGHLRVVQASFAEVLTHFIKTRYAGVPNLDLVSEVAGATLAAALVVAVQKRGHDGCAGDLGEIVAASVDLVRSGLGPLG